ncbi:MAG: DUF3617 family protein [Desulfobacterium sp.]|nr:DUF3617 family protein [Desulfobacterium sp.]
MLKITVFSLFGVCVLLLCSTFSYAFDFNPGTYEITSTVEMPGMPVGSVPPQTIVQCVTAQDPIPETNAESEDCKMKNMKQAGNTVTWELECVLQGQTMASQGEIRYAGDNFKGTVIMEMGPEVGSMTITTVITGKRLGNCQ